MGFRPWNAPSVSAVANTPLSDAPMNSEQLKSIQALIKDRYRTDPESALVTIRTEGNVNTSNQHCSLQSFAGTVRAGLHPAAGGTDADACSAELLLESLVACAGVTFSAVATNMNITVTSCKISVEGDMDFRGTMGTDRNAPVGFTAVRLHFQVDADADEATVAKLISLTERYCVIYQTLKNGVAVTTG